MTGERQRLTGTRYDLLVVGGGIHGLFAAYDAARRGLAVALVEQADFGSGLSFNHQRTIHGGLRALEIGQPGKARQQIIERRTWVTLAPHLIRPLPFLLGTYRGTKRSRWLIGAGFAAYNAIGHMRNQGLPAAWHLPASRVLSRAEIEAAYPGIERSGLTGGACWYDYQARHPDRLNWLVARAAIAAGAVLVNHAEAIAPLREHGRIVGVRVRHWPDGLEADVLAAATLLCAGSGLPSLLASFGLGGAPPLTAATNLLLDRPAGATAFAAPGRSGRMLTAVPWGGHTLVGTFQSTSPVGADTPAHPAGALDAMLEDLAGAFPALAAGRSDIRLIHHGLTPAVVRNGRTDLMPDAQVLTHARDGAPGLYSLVGVKFTTARHAAALALDEIVSGLGRRLSPCTTASALLPDGSDDGAAASVRRVMAERTLTLPAALEAHLVDWYGTEAGSVLSYCADRALTEPLGTETQILSGELAYAVAHSQAVRLSDAVLRRTRLGGTGHPGAGVLSAAATIVGRELGWSPAAVASEIAEVERRYAH